MYNEVAEEMLDKLRAQPLKTIPLILKRLKKCREGHLQQKREHNKRWKECCEKNFHKSLDHKSFYFKQSEKRSTNTKGILNQVI